MKEVVFCAGKAFDSFGRPTPFWTGVVAYLWSAEKQAFHVYSVQVLGTGTVTDGRSSEELMSSCDDINNLLDYFKELKRHYKEVYEVYGE